MRLGNFGLTYGQYRSHVMHVAQGSLNNGTVGCFLLLRSRFRSSLLREV
jgi:hypothetical protein